MSNEVVNGGTSGDTTHIDDVIAYLESPEYLRMIARQQGESPDSLLSGSSSEPWRNVGTASMPASGRPAPAMSSGDAAQVTADHPWSASLTTGDLVTLVTNEIDTIEVDMANSVSYFRVRDAEGTEWSVPSENLTPYREGLADWERELLENVPPLPRACVSPTDGCECATCNAPEPTGAHAATFGVQWNNAENRCGCVTCARSRVVVPETPALNPNRIEWATREPRPLKLRVRDPWWEFRHPLHDRREFNTYGSLRGRKRPESESCGYLADKSSAAYALWRADQNKIDYVVYSYRTPIAWHVTGRDYSEWIYPDVRYSATTSAQQNKIKTALDANENQYMVDTVRSIREA